MNVIRLSYYNQIFRPIIKFIAVKMMNFFFWFKFSLEELLQNKTVVKHSCMSSRDCNSQVTSFARVRLIPFVNSFKGFISPPSLIVDITQIFGCSISDFSFATKDRAIIHKLDDTRKGTECQL